MKKILLHLTLIFSMGCIAQTPSAFHTSFLFNGTNQYIDVPSASAVLENIPFTVEAWVNIPTSANLQTVMASTNPSDGWQLEIQPNLLLNFGKHAVSNPNSTMQIPANVWTHIAVTFNGSIVQYYINGDTAGTVSAVYTFNSGSDYTVGADMGEVSGGFRWCKGNIDELRFWSTIRTQAEIDSDMCHELTGTEPNLKLYYDLNEVTGATVNDLTTDHYTGTIMPSPYTAADMTGASVFCSTCGAPGVTLNLVPDSFNTNDATLITLSGGTIETSNTSYFGGYYTFGGQAKTSFTPSVVGSGIFQVAYIDSNGSCMDTAQQNLYINQQVGINEISAEKSIRVYPIPADNELFIIDQALSIQQINIYDIAGSLVSQKIQTQINSIDVSAFSSGIYVLEIFTDRGTILKRWVKM